MAKFPVPWHPDVEITVLGRHGIENRETRKFVLGTHTGTHCDAPRHIVPGGMTVDEIPLDVFVGPARLVDLTPCGKNQEFGATDLEQRLGAARPERIILRFDWSDHWGQPSFYGQHPFISQDAARWLVQRGVKLLAMDTPMPDNPAHGRGSPLDSPVHKILLDGGVILVEYLCNLKALRRPEIELIVLPLKIRDGDGSPVRCIAIEDV
jgi:kynurenine formamidase